jgi:hypothetical protein
MCSSRFHKWRTPDRPGGRGHGWAARNILRSWPCC